MSINCGQNSSKLWTNVVVRISGSGPLIFYLYFDFFIYNLSLNISQSKISPYKQFFKLLSLRMTFRYFYVIYFARILHLTKYILHKK